MLQHERIAAIIEAYDLQGIHRTATQVDQQSANWLADEVRAAGRVSLGEFVTQDGLIPASRGRRIKRSDRRGLAGDGVR